MRNIGSLLLIVALCITFSTASADELSLNNVQPPEPNRSDEAKAEQYSLKAATHFLDQSALNWTKKRKCFTCHTNYLYLVARPTVSAKGQAHADIRNALQQLVSKRWAKQGPRWDAEVVMSAAVLALNDAATTGKLHPLTQHALDRMWTLQREDGGVDWLNCDWPPMESDDHFGATMMAVAAGVAPEKYRESAAAQKGLALLRKYFSDNPPITLHQRAMLLWADSFQLDLLDPQQRKSIIQDLLQLQNLDGGWALPALGKSWKRSDGKQQNYKQSDGYGTGFVIYILRQAGIKRDHHQLKQGIVWLKQNQRASGRWFTRSVYKDSKHYISHAGTAFAVLALTACEPIKPQP